MKLILLGAMMVGFALPTLAQVERHERETTTVRVHERGGRPHFDVGARVHFGIRHDRDDFRFRRFPRHGHFNGFEVYVINGCDYYLANDGCWYPVRPDCGPIFCE